ncbi:MAG: hypothetical protein WCD53_11475 [Microcoleus sp.]
MLNHLHFSGYGREKVGKTDFERDFSHRTPSILKTCERIAVVDLISNLKSQRPLWIPSDRAIATNRQFVASL